MTRRPYQWPASRLDAGLMKCLHQHATRTGKPITRTVREAIVAYVVHHAPGVVPDPEPHDMPQGGAADGGR